MDFGAFLGDLTVKDPDMDKICDHICGESNLNGDNIIDLIDAYLLNAMLMYSKRH